MKFLKMITHPRFGYLEATCFGVLGALRDKINLLHFLAAIFVLVFTVTAIEWFIERKESNDRTDEQDG